MNEKNTIYKLVFTSENANPNGNPDAANRPRTMYRNGYEYAYMTGIAIKRDIRDFLIKNNKGSSIFYHKGTYQEDTVSATEADLIKKGEIGVISEDEDEPDAASEKKGKNKGKSKKAAEKNKKDIETLINALLDKYWDIRMFGSPLAIKGKSGNSVIGAVQIFDAVSVNPVTVTYDTVIVTSPTSPKKESKEDAKKQKDENASGDSDADYAGSMGGRYSIPFALFEAYCRFDSRQAQKNRVKDVDKELFEKLLLYFIQDCKTTSKNFELVEVIKYEQVETFGDTDLDGCWASKKEIDNDVTYKLTAETAMSIKDFERTQKSDEEFKSWKRTFLA